MARTKAITGKGTTLYYADDDVMTAPVKVGELVNVGQPEITSGSTDATHYESDSDFEESIATGWNVGSEIPFTINYEKSQLNTLRGLIGLDKYFKITYPDTSTDVFPGTITALGGGDIPLRDTIRSQGKIKIEGPVVFTPAA